MTGRRVLLVDDEEGIRLSLGANLELEGYTVLEAHSAEAALQILQQQPVDVVLTDICMPGMTGVELFQAVRKRGLDTPVVLMTGFAREELLGQALGEGAFAVLAKPFDVDDALRTLSNAVRGVMVLVVDDMSDVATTTAEALKATGLRARAVTSADEAIASVKAGDVDLCVVDLVMPGVSGAELAARLAVLDPPVTVIAVSGQDVPAMIREVAAAGMYAFLKKPFAIRELVLTIARARSENARGAA